MAELERALAALAAAEQTHLQEPRLQGAAPNGVARAEGVVLYKLFKVYREAQALYRLKDSNSRYSDWPHMSADLLSMVPLGELAAETAAKLELHRQMLRTYTVLQP